MGFHIPNLHIDIQPDAPVRIVVAASIANAITEDYVKGLAFLILVGATAYLYATGKEIPQGLYAFDSFIIGYYFGSGVKQFSTAMDARLEQIQRDVRAVKKQSK